MRAFVCILAILALTVSASADWQLGRAQSALSSDSTARGEGDSITPMLGSAANDCSTVYPVGVLPAGGVFAVGGGNTCGALDDFDVQADFTGMCADMGNSSGEDEIWEFQVASTGYWTIGTCWAGFSYAGYYTTYWDTSLGIYQNDGACPGDPHACDGDGTGCPEYSSLIEDAFLAEGNTYYLVVDSFYTGACGTYTWVFTQTAEACDEDADCDDGLACNGAETCDVAAGGVCLPSTDTICECYQHCVEPGVCVDPDPCYVWETGPGGGYGPISIIWPGSSFNARGADDVEVETHGATRDLISYQMQYASYTGWAGDAVDTPYHVDTQLFLTELVTCLPWVGYPGTGCGFDLVVKQSGIGAPPDTLLCEPNGGLPTGLPLPDSSGVADLCEIDCYMVAWGAPPSGAAGHRTTAYRTDNCPGQDGVNSGKYVGELGFEDEIGQDIWVHETIFGSGDWDLYAWNNGVADFGNAFICTAPAGGCCFNTGGCEDLTESACATAGGTYAGHNTMGDPIGCDDPDADGFFNTCDNCPDLANDGQEDCNDDGEGDACEADPAEQDDDGDGTCNGVDGCPNDPLKIAPGQCGCGNPDTDSDLDGVADCIDECDDNPLWQTEPACGCDSTTADNGDDDGDGFENCFDTCAGVDDAVFGPCTGDPIPTVSEWGLVVLALLLLVAGKVYFGRRPELS